MSPTTTGMAGKTPQGALSYNGSSQWLEHRGALVGGVRHDHTYCLPPTHSDNPPFKVAKQPAKEKQPKNFKTEDPLTRDEETVRAMYLPITTNDIINLPIWHLNCWMNMYDLSKEQESQIRDIRRRGKAKVARKRKMDEINQLADEVQRLREEKREQNGLLAQQQDLKLSHTILKAVRRSDGSPNKPSLYKLWLQRSAKPSSK